MSQQINLLDQLPKPPVHYLQPQAMIAIVLVCMGLAISIVAYKVANNYLLSRSYNELVYKRQEIERGLITMAKTSKANVELNTLQDQITTLQLQIEERQQLLNFPAVKQLQNTEGFSPYLISIAKRVMPGLWLDKISIQDNGDEITLHGKTVRAQSVMTFLHSLRNEPKFRGKLFRRYELSKRDDKTGEIEFKLKTMQ